MKRCSTFLAGMAIAAAMAACGDTGGTTADLKMPDLSMPDLATPPDMTFPGKGTGETCTKVADCAKGLGPSQAGQCFTTVQGTPWPGGYCTSQCRTTRTDTSSGINTDCPPVNGTQNGTCFGSGATGTCVQVCESSMDCRQGYGCFVVNNYALGCLPLAFSDCDPSKRGSCSGTGDGGAPPADMSPVVDGSVIMYPDTCVNIGDGTVGACVPGCDPMTNKGCDPAGMDTDCHASDVTGEGLCVGPAPVGTKAGSACGNFYSDCPGGYGCLSGKCWKYCNDANKATQCSPGANCVKFSQNSPVPTSVAGICTMSP